MFTRTVYELSFDPSAEFVIEGKFVTICINLAFMICSATSP